MPVPPPPRPFLPPPMTLEEAYKASGGFVTEEVAEIAKREKERERWKPDKTPTGDKLYFLSLKLLYSILLPVMIIKTFFKFLIKGGFDGRK